MCLPEALPPAEIALIIAEMRSCSAPQKISKPMYTPRSRQLRKEREARLEDAAIDNGDYQARGIFLLKV